MFKLTSIRALTLTDSNGCVLGTESREVTVFFRVDSVTIKNDSASAVLHAGLNSDATSLYGFYPVTIDGTGDPALSQAESQIMALEYFSGAVSV
ncbi:hypothetical protein PRZ30_001986 [Klebsiella pneumoniae]|nr:hypothetical protein [Klebsiella pneumoniae]